MADVRYCFACNSAVACEHREQELLTGADYAAWKRAILEESTRISQAELEAIHHDTQLIQIVPRKPAVSVEKSLETQVKSC
jgi:hypothetical protein